MEQLNNLDDVLRSSWNLLFRATVQRRDPFRTPVLATIAHGMPAARTVVLRAVDTQKQQLLFYTDYRTPKVAQLQANPVATCVFWNPSRHVQIRATGTMLLHHKDEFAVAKWQQIPAKNRRDYSTIAAPGTAQSTPDNFLPEYWTADQVTTAKTEEHFEHFVVLELLVQTLDWLHLNREGHRRAKFEFENGVWKKSWVIP